MSIANEMNPTKQVSLGQSQLQALLGDALGELEYLRLNQLLGHKALRILQRRANIAVRKAEAPTRQGVQPSSAMERDLQTQVLALDFQASKAHLEVHQWKRRAAMLQLKLDSQCEDGLCAQQYSNILSREVHRQQHAVKAAERQCQLLKGELQQARMENKAQEQALLAAGIESDKASAAAAEQAAKHTELVWAQQRAKDLEARVLEARKQQTSDSAQAAAQEAALKREVEQMQKLIAQLEEKGAAAKQSAEDKLRAMKQNAEAQESHLRQQIQELKNLVALQRNERQASEQSWRARVKDIEEHARLDKAHKDNLHVQADENEAEPVADEDDEEDNNSQCCSEDAEAAMDLVNTLFDTKQSAADIADKVLAADKKLQKATKKSRPSKKSREALEFSDLGASKPLPGQSEQVQEGAKRATALIDAERQAVVAPPRKAASKKAASNSNKTDTSADVREQQAVEGSKRPTRQCRTSQPYWIVQPLTEGESPLAENPTPSSVGQSDADDPSFTAELAGSKVVTKTKGEAVDKENQPAAKRQKRSTVGANESEDEGALRAADAGGNTHQADKAASTASEAAEAQVGEIVQNSMKGAAKSKAGGRKSRLGPHAKPDQQMQGASAAEDKLPAAKDAAKAADPTQTSTEESVQAHEDAAAAVESRRPDGVSKIDLRDVWGGRTPASSPEGAAAEPAGKGAVEPPGAGRSDPAVESSRDATAAASQFEKDPLKAINGRVVKAAASRKEKAEGAAKLQLGSRRSQLKQPTQLGLSKRKLQPPSVLNNTLPRDLLLGPAGGFKIPKLKKPTGLAG